jgi:hypothetical protein
MYPDTYIGIHIMKIKRNPTKTEVKRIISKGNKLEISIAIFRYWKLEDKFNGWLPYKDN